MPWAVAGAVVGAGISAYGSRSASKTQADSARDASATELAMFNRNREDQAPWRGAGEGALAQLSDLLGISPTGSGAQTQGNFDRALYLRNNPDVAEAGVDPYQHWLDFGQSEGREFPLSQAARDSASKRSENPEFGSFNRDFSLADFTADPGYQFRMDEGRKGLESSAAARGGLLSGGTLKALTKYGQDVASNEYSNAYNRFNNDRTQRFNRLSGIAGTGQTATNITGQLGAQAASNIAQNQIGAGNARASGYVGQANAINSGIGNAMSGYQLSQLGKSNTPDYVNWNTGTGAPGSSGAWGGTASDPWYG